MNKLKYCYADPDNFNKSLFFSHCEIYITYMTQITYLFYSLKSSPAMCNKGTQTLNLI